MVSWATARKRAFVRYSIAVVAVWSAFGLRLLLIPLTGTGAPFVLFFAAVLVTNIYAGPGPGLLATLLSAGLGVWLFVLRHFTLTQAVGQGILFLIDGLIVLYLAYSMTRARLAAEEAAAREHRAVRLRDDLIAAMSHDLRNPITAIEIRARLISEGDWPPDHASLQRQVVGIMTTTARMRRLVENLLDLARLEATGLTLNLSMAPVDQLIKEVLATAGPLADAKGVQVEYHRCEACAVLCDAPRLVQAIENVVGNAIKFTPEGGSVVVTPKLIGSSLEVEVRDTGPGIHESLLPHVFDRYWQATPGKRGGVGLGLAIAKGIVEAHGGNLRITSRPGEGTSVFLTVPKVSMDLRQLPSENALPVH